MSALRTTIVCAAALLGMAGTAVAAPKPVTLTKLGGTPALGEGGAEIAAFQPLNDRLYTTNATANRLDVWDVSNPAAPSALPSIDLSPYGAGPNSVATSKRCGGLVAVAVEANPKTAPGKVVIFRSATGAHVKTLTVGALPDMLTFNTTGNRLLVANEGEPANDGSADPVGSISIIKGFPRRNCTDLSVTTLGLDGTFPRYGDIRTFGPAGTTFGQSAEPEYITIDQRNGGNGSKAFVTIQEANAIATVDLASETIESVRGLGSIDYGDGINQLDASDRDSAVNIRSWPGVFGMPQPDAISWFTTAGREYLITADEGDSRDWSYYSEVVRAGSANYPLDPTAFPNAATLKQLPNLGRLNVTRATGDLDNDSDFDRIYTFGGRGVSITPTTGTGGFTWNSGPAFEQFTAGLGNLALFNPSHGATAVFDDRSDDKGPEPEGITTGRVGGRPYAFVGLERQSGILALDLRDELGKAKIAGYVNTRPVDRGPEGLGFITAGDSPTGAPLVYATNEITGTVAFYSVSAS